MLKRILDAARQPLLQEESRLLGELRVVLVRLHASEESQRALARSIAQLEELFLLVVVGEFNTGKSAVINALLGAQILEEGVTPTTSRIGLVKHGPAAGRAPAGGGCEAITLPLDILREITLVDTPGTNAVLREHEAITREFIPRADLVLFVTSADRPFTESERKFLEAIQSWGKKVMFALNKVDILETADDVGAVVDFVKEQALALLGLRPRVFAVSARDARRARADGNAALLRTSGFGELESFVTHTLNEGVRLRLKLLNPVGVGLRVGGEAEALVEERLAFLKDDSAVLAAVDGQLARDRESLGGEIRLRFADVDKTFVEYAQRAGDAVDQTLQPRHVLRLMDGERTRVLFERELAADLPRVLERQLDEIVGWLVAKQAGQWQAVAERVQSRQALHGDRIANQMLAEPDHDGSRLLHDVRREIQRAVESEAPRAEARRLARAARGAATAGLLLQPAAISLAAVAIALGSGWVRVSAVLLAVALSIVGVLLLPMLRKRAGVKLRQTSRSLHETLAGRLKARLDGELDANRQRALDALQPYRQFVGSEAERFSAQRDQLRTLRGGLEALRERLQSL